MSLHLQLPRPYLQIKSWRLRSLPNRKIPVDLLPMELWEAVFHELPDKDLLRAAAVCQPFNTLCIVIYLARNRVSPALMTESGPLYLYSHLLTALQLSCLTPPTTHLCCHFWDFAIRRNLDSLRDFIRRSGTLSQFSLSFTWDLFSVPKRAEHAGDSHRAVLSAFRDVLYEMAKKQDGPVIVLSPISLFTCRPRDVSAWRLHRHQFNRGLTPVELFRRIRSLVRTPYWHRSTVRLFDGTPLRLPALQRMKTVAVISTDVGLPLRGTVGTVVVFDLWCITHLDLYDDSQPLHLQINCVDLGAFLLRQPLLSVLNCSSYGRLYEGTTPLISPPITHPTLTTISTNGQGKVLYTLLNALDQSPNLFTLSFNFFARSPPQISEWNVALRRISLRTRETRLKLYLSSAVLEQVFEEEELQIAGSLQCVSTVKVTCWSLRSGTSMIPWLVRLPALRRVKIKLYSMNWSARSPAEDQDIDELIALVSAALPHVSEVLGRSR
ncbi:hypothetical protein C8J57DRAFT_1499266 [Mycena rebaudengoi]|nr:hypothetical protein C8J57DRAFT_1499266 [Mycena rebaudengoi]